MGMGGVVGVVVRICNVAVGRLGGIGDYGLGYGTMTRGWLLFEGVSIGGSVRGCSM